MAADRFPGIALLTASESGRRNRRTIDSVLLAAAAIVIGLSTVIASEAPEHDAAVARALHTVLGWADPLWRAAFVSALGLALLVLGAVCLHRRWELVRDVLFTLAGLAAAASILSYTVHADWFPVKVHLLARWGYPDLRLAAATAVIIVVGPELVRPARLVAWWLVPSAAIGGVVLYAGLPSEMLGALSLGLGAGALARFTFGTAAGVPLTEDVRAVLSSLGIQTLDLRLASKQRVGAAEYVGHDTVGDPLKVRVLGRDAQDTQRLARRFHALAYRDPPRSVAVGRLEQVEHEALVTLMASQAGVRVPEVVTAALGPDGDAVLVTRQPDQPPLEDARPDQVSNEVLRQLWGQVERLHSGGISHGRLNASSVLVLKDGPMLVDFSAATLGAPQSALDIDVAELLVACTVLVGPERALDEATSAGWGKTIERVLPYLQRAALTPHLRDLARSHEVSLKELRASAAVASGQDAPELAPLRRVGAKDLLLTAALVFAAYLLISQLADIGFGTIAHELHEANAAWVVVALILAQLSFVGSGLSVRGAVATPLPLLPCVVLQSAIKFINLTVPSSAGRIGMNLRFLQRMGAPLPEAVAAGAVDDASETIVQLALFLVALPLVNVHLDTSRFRGGGPNSRLIAAIGIALVISVVVAMAIPKVRAKILPPLRDALSGLWSVARDRHKRLELFGGNIASELFYALALGATCLAYGVHLNLAQLVFVNTAASVLSGLVPVPGGIGTAEASLSAGLIAMGVDESTAFAIALTQRLCTFYLPPIWGYASVQWLSRKGFL